MDEPFEHEHTSLSIQSLLTRLLEAQTRASEAEGQLDTFRVRTAPAPASAEFKDVQALAHYVNQRARYQRELDQLTAEYQEHLQKYEDVKGAVAAILPPGTSIVHDYQGGHYQISHTPGRRVEVRQLTHDEYLLRQQRPTLP
jgi:hypothetical protein